MQPFRPRSRAIAVLCAASLAPATYGLAQTAPGQEITGLLRGGLSSLCEPAMLCSFGLYGRQPLPHEGEALWPQGGPQTPPRAVAASGVSPAIAPAQLAPPSGVSTSATVVAGDAAAGVAGSVLSPTFSTGTGLGTAARADGIDYSASIGLRGQYGVGGQSPGLEIVIVPQVGVRIAGSRLTAEAGASAELIQDIPGEAGIGALDLNAAASYALDSRTDVSLSSSARLARAEIATDELPSAVMTEPLAFTGGVEAGLVRTAGRNLYEIGASFARESTGDAVLEDGTIVTDEASNLMRAGLQLRLSREIAPALTGFAEAGATRTDFDRLGSDNWYYTASAGVAGEWRSLSGEVSVGTGLRVYDSASPDENESLFFAASLAYLPITNLTLNAGVTSAIVPGFDSESGGLARQNAVTLSAAYAASSWLGLTADASYLWELDADGALAYETYGAGVGADLAVLPHTTLSAGYDYAVTNEAGVAAEGGEHRVTLGVTLER